MIIITLLSSLLEYICLLEMGARLGIHNIHHDARRYNTRSPAGSSFQEGLIVVTDEQSQDKYRRKTRDFSMLSNTYMGVGMYDYEGNIYRNSRSSSIRMLMYIECQIYV